MAIKCSTALVEPPVAQAIVKAFSKAWRGHNVARLEIEFEKHSNGFARGDTFFMFQRIFGGRGRTVRQRHAERFNRRGHRVRGIHAATRAGAGASMANNLLALRIVDFLGKKFAVALKGRNDIELLRTGVAGADGAAINHDGWAIEPAHGDHAAGHVLIAAGDGNVGVIPLRRHQSFNRIGNEIARLQREAHAIGSHGNSVADTDGVEAHADHAGSLDAFLDLFGKVEQMHVAGVAFEPHAGDAHLRLLHVLFIQAGGIKHGLRCALRLGFGDDAAVAVYW